MSEPNKVLERCLIEEVYNRGNLAVVTELIASDYVGHSSPPADETHGPEGFRQYVVSLRAAFPDIHFAIEDQIAEGDRVVTRWTAHATHTGAFQGIPPTGKPGRVTGITIDRIANGKVVECWTNMNELGLLQQLGFVPAPKEVASA